MDNGPSELLINEQQHLRCRICAETPYMACFLLFLTAGSLSGLACVPPLIWRLLASSWHNRQTNYSA